ncbi:MAG: 3-hydroxyanthranilate 3,4-dioxygenase, partial [Bacteroidia bacterium]
KKNNEKDGLLWFCENCNTKLHEVYFNLTDIATQFQGEFKRFYTSTALRTCKQCGHMMEPPPTIA